MFIYFRWNDKKKMRKIVIFFIIVHSVLSTQSLLFAQSKLQSLILLGMGELNMGYKDRARSFFIREAALWFICLGGKKAANWYANDYYAFAALHAGVNMEGKDYIFSVNMGHYDSFTEYNNIKERQRQIHAIYDEGQGYEWQWDNKQNRIHFDNIGHCPYLYHHGQSK